MPDERAQGALTEAAHSQNTGSSLGHIAFSLTTRRGISVALTLLASLAGAEVAAGEEIKLKTNRGGSCTVNAFADTTTTYGVTVDTSECATRNGIWGVGSFLFLMRGSEIVDTSEAEPARSLPHSNVRTHETPSSEEHYARLEFWVTLNRANTRRERRRPERWRPVQESNRLECSSHTDSHDRERMFCRVLIYGL